MPRDLKHAPTSLSAKRQRPSAAARKTQPPDRPERDAPTARMDDSSPRTMVQVPADRLVDALAGMVLMGEAGGSEAAERFIAYAQSSLLDLDQCWAVQNQDRLAPVCLAVPNPGRAALMFVTPPEEDSAIEDLSRLLIFAVSRMDRKRIVLAQVLLSHCEHRMRAAFVRAGFTQLAELSYLERKIPPLSRAPRVELSDECSIEPLTGANESDFKKALLASYEGTLDCPGLCGLRSIEDVMAGHQATGVFEPDLWTLVRFRGEPAGVLLLASLPDQGVIELSYLGVGAEFRGRGLGKLLLQHGLRQLAGRAEERITLAVDEANSPALKLYRSRGFYQIDRRIAMIRPVGDE